MALDSSALLTLQASQMTAQSQTQTGALSALAHAKDPKKNAKLGQDFETMCLSNLLSPMFDGLSTDGIGGGGEGEAAVRSFYVDAMAKEMAKRGGVGISSMMQKELLKLQGAK
jgi:flagellar protein FlgJ